MELYAQQNSFIHIETAPYRINISIWRQRGWNVPDVNRIPRRVEGYGCPEKKKKIRNRWVSLWADTKWFQEQQKLSLPKSKEGKPWRTFFTCVALKCEYQRVSSAEFKTRYNCKRLSQPINSKRVRVRLDRSLHALVPQINCRDAASATGHFTFKYLRNTTEIREPTQHMNLTLQLVNWEWTAHWPSDTNTWKKHQLNYLDPACLVTHGAMPRGMMGN